MMIGPKSFIEQYKDKSYEELIDARDNLIREIQHFEKLEKEGDHSGEEWMIHPQPDVRYQVNLEYLSALCSYMSEKYNEECVWGDKKLFGRE